MIVYPSRGEVYQNHPPDRGSVEKKVEPKIWWDLGGRDSHPDEAMTRKKIMWDLGDSNP